MGTDPAGKWGLSQCCPDVQPLDVDKQLRQRKEFMFLPGLDLNSEEAICHPARRYLAGAADEPGQAGVRAVDRAFAVDDVSSLRGALSWRVQGQIVQLPGSVFVYGVCATDVPRELARDRSVPACAAAHALSHGHSQQ